ncbi:hypothetical protein [Haliangium sp.]|uniref:hypothetical protein n=1 Tax=Haliangium sp. TaxID=2663208 RepID=UPI003D103E97
MATQRKQRVDAFRAGIQVGDREDADSTLFRVLFGIPAQIQIELALEITRRFLPVFRKNHPEHTAAVAWAESVLGDLGAYYDARGVEVSDPPEKDAGGDASFWYALYALLDAVSYAKQGKLHRVTPACCTALIWAVGARSANIWYADDPDAVQAWNDGHGEPLLGRGEHENLACLAVTKREWLIVADWLEQRQVGDYPEADEDERERWLAWWQERECLL